MGRYQSKIYAALDNIDLVPNVFQAFDPFVVIDARVQYKVSDRSSFSFGIDNILNEKYQLFHPFPQRTYIVQGKARSEIAMRFIALLAFLLLMCAQAFAHAHLERAQPPAGGSVAAAPREVTVWFTRNIETAFSRIEVRNAAGAAVHDGATRRDAADRKQMSVRLKPLPPGTYTVHWRVLSVDTHKTEGNFSFSVGK